LRIAAKTTERGTLVKKANIFSVSAAVALEIVKNLMMKIPTVRSLRVRQARTALPPCAAELDRYAYQLLDSVEKYAGGVVGKSILEIGPGDNLVSGLAFLAAGARSYTVLDRFPGAYESETARHWYRLLAEHWPYGEWPAHLDPMRFPTANQVTVIRESVESAGVVGSFDVVCSYAVGEHVSDIDAFAQISRKAIGESGVGVHTIDFSGHWWDRFGDPFLFLKFPELIWRLMGSERGLPNRVRFDEFYGYFERNGLTVEVPNRVLCDVDPTDPWVAGRADDSFRTMAAVFVVRQTPAFRPSI